MTGAVWYIRLHQGKTLWSWSSRPHGKTSREESAIGTQTLALPRDKRRIQWLLLAAVGVFLLPGLLLGPAKDAAVFAVVGEQMLRGDLPYRDVWDHKPPGIYGMTALAALMPGSTWPWVWALSVAATTISALLVYRVAGAVAAVFAAIGMSVYPASFGGGHTETFAATLAALSLVTGHRHRQTGAGLLSVAALAFSFQALPVVAAHVVLAGRNWVRYLVGCALGVVVIVLAFVVAGVAAEAADALVRYSRAYLGLEAGLDEWALISIVLLPFAFLPLYVRWAKLSQLERAAAAWAICGLLLLAFQGRHLGHYVVPVVVPLSILAGRAIRIPTARRVMAIAGTCAVGLAVAVSIPMWIVHRSAATAAIGDYVASLAPAGKPILVWGMDARVYLRASRPVAGEYPYLLPLVTPGYTTPAMINDWLDDLQAQPPAVIVDSEAAHQYWDATDDFLRPPPPGYAGGRTLDLLEPFRVFVAAHYELSAEIAGRKIYVLLEQPQGDT